jgi:hypothetical protein
MPSVYCTIFEMEEDDGGEEESWRSDERGWRGRWLREFAGGGGGGEEPRQAEVRTETHFFF